MTYYVTLTHNEPGAPKPVRYIISCLTFKDAADIMEWGLNDPFTSYRNVHMYKPMAPDPRKYLVEYRTADEFIRETKG